ncbi:Long-chain-fatty-acid--CoA ligase [Virgibacillus phasianinus]|uniref:Long-chain-fatty-acid--CoA ligase n=1 Tax=Virgibacillus phasianinus TaxID=2017483 RepID=A0A220U782_9BACI|nr:AMP-binding protein [Virgibacillus phasianinus]ASK63701.1 Long-chain-fatty-acid--CoA ligase [Virgibacillus phasianinus]
MVSTTIRVVNDQGIDVQQDGKEIGEIIVKGPGVIGSDDEWLHTGDKGTIDGKGHVTIVDRKKDILLNGKDAISSIEVERVFHDHPAIQEAAIIVTPHKELGEVLHAIVVLKEAHLLTMEELFQYAKENLEEVKRPNEITFIDELPKTPSGKIQKLHLKELI